MPRSSRKKSRTGTYHIMLRAVNQQQIFEDNEDRQRFLKILKDCKVISEFKLYAYCLMGNHIHLLIQEVAEPIDQIMKRIETRFVYWYNIKYQRRGHLFQDRYKSEAVEDDSYFLSVIRYIHQNPVKAGICKTVSDYEYSSFNEFYKKSDLIDSDQVFSLLTEKDFAEYNNEINNDKCLEAIDSFTKKVTDEQAQQIIEMYSKCKNVAEFQKLDVKNRDKCLKIFREKGLSIRQVSRLTGVSFNIARKF